MCQTSLDHPRYGTAWELKYDQKQKQAHGQQAQGFSLQQESTNKTREHPSLATLRRVLSKFPKTITYLR